MFHAAPLPTNAGQPFSVRADRRFPRLWLVMSEDSATLQAAGAIHSDLEQGFIRAEVVAYEALIRCGSLAPHGTTGRYGSKERITSWRMAIS